MHSFPSFTWLELLFEYNDYLNSPRGTKRRRGIVKEMVAAAYNAGYDSQLMFVIGRIGETLSICRPPSEDMIRLMARVAAQRLPFFDDDVKYIGPTHKCYMQDYRHLYTSIAT